MRYMMAVIFMVMAQNVAANTYDKGHLQPSEEVPNSSMLANFPSSNESCNNWLQFKENAKKLAQEKGNVYILTKPIYENVSKNKSYELVARTHYYKVLVDSSNKEIMSVVVPVGCTYSAM